MSSVRLFSCWFFAVVAGLALPGCLSDSYAIRRDELLRIAELPPENRGSHVRVTQQTSFSDSYAEPDPLAPTEPEPLPQGEPTGPVVVVESTSVYHQHHHHHAELGVAAGTRAPRRQPAHLRSIGGGGNSTSLSVGASGTGSGSGGGKGGDAQAAVVVAVAALAVTTGAFSIAAFTEGPRFDGWAWIPPEQQILIKPKSAAPYWIPLSDLTAEQANSAQGAEILPTKAQLLEHAPLNRVGVSTSLELGGSAMRSTQSGRLTGFMARYALGGFPLQWLGVLGNAGFGAGDDNGTVFDGRLGLELRLMPVHIGPVHLGAYGELGHTWLLHDMVGGTARGDGAYYGGGGLLEFDLNTRLGLFLRGGAAVLPRYGGQLPTQNDSAPFGEFTVGLSVY